MNFKELELSLSEIRKELSVSISDATNGNELVEHLTRVMAYQSLSADTVARAESFLNNEIAKVIESCKYDDMSASDKKVLTQRDVAKYVEAYNKSVNYNKELHYKIESLRTLISNAKELLKNNL